VPGVRTFPTLSAVEGIGIDFADICTPPALHHEHAVESLARGWHVLCEKPFVLQSEHAAAIRRIATTRNLAVVPAHNWKYAPILSRATSLLDSGAIGPLRQVTIVTSRTQAAATTAGAAYNWRQDPRVAGGGILMDHGWHAVYLALHWFHEVPVSSAGELRRTAPDAVESDVDLVLRFPSGDARIVLTWNGAARRNAVTLTGERGAIVVENGTLTCPGLASEPFESLSAGSHHAAWFTAMLPDVTRCFADPDRSRPRLAEAEECLRIIEQVYADAAALAPGMRT
jgi:predicted dehydrogenase